MNKTLTKILKDLQHLHTAECEYLEKTDKGAGAHSYLAGMEDAMEIVQRYIEIQYHDDIRQGRNEI